MLVWCSVAATSFVTLEPTFVGVMIERLKLSHAAAGYVSAAMVALSACGSLLLLVIGRLATLRTFALCAALVMAATDVGSALAQDDALQLALRGAHSIASGVLFGVVNALASGSRAPGRLFAAMLAGQLLLGAVGHYLLPDLLAHGGVPAVFLALAGLCVPVILGWPLLPAQPRLAGRSVIRRDLPTHQRRTLLSLLLMYTGYMAIWTYLERIGVNAGLTPQAIRAALSASMLAGLAGAALAWLLATRADARRLLLAGLVVMAAGTLALHLSQATWIYFAATLAVNAAQVFVVPPYLAQLATGRQDSMDILLAGPVISLGIVLGPVLGALSGEGSGHRMLVTGSAIFALLALAMSWVRPPRPR